MQPLQSMKPFTATINLLNYSPIHIDITEGQNLKDLVSHLICQHNIPSYLTSSIYSTLTSAIAAIPQSTHHNIDNDIIIQREKNHPEEKHKEQDEPNIMTSTRDRFITKYQSHTLQYHNKPEEVNIKFQQGVFMGERRGDEENRQGEFDNDSRRRCFFYLGGERRGSRKKVYFF
ncbi:hypothetical protein BDC45DRAFT_493942, partial [Circinella umbellata]